MAIKFKVYFVTEFVVESYQVVEAGADFIEKCFDEIIDIAMARRNRDIAIIPSLAGGAIEATVEFMNTKTIRNLATGDTKIVWYE